MSKRQVSLTVYRGVIDETDFPENIRLIVKDYDIEYMEADDGYPEFNESESGTYAERIFQHNDGEADVVVLTMQGGCLDTESAPDDVEVMIIDHDEEGYDEEGYD